MKRDDSEDLGLLIPVELAELLHAALGPLADVLTEEGHEWADIANIVLRRYVSERDRFLKFIHGESVCNDIAHHTVSAVETVCALSDAAIKDRADFIQWAAEVDADPV